MVGAKYRFSPVERRAWYVIPLVDVPFPPRRMALLGTGYIGGSVALAARRVGLTAAVVGYDLDPAAAEAARRCGVVDAIAPSAADAVACAELVVLSAPVAGLAALARAIAPALSPTALVIDVGSVKGSVARAIEPVLGGQFVACHPMAGTERSGAAAAEDRLFDGKLCFVCPGAGTTAVAQALATAFWQALGGRVLVVDVDHHDKLMAAVSHLPHVAAYALAASLAGVMPLLEGGGAAAAPTTSLRDTTRIAASNPAVWRDILLENREHLLPLARALEATVRQLRTAMETADAVALEAVLVAGRDVRDRLVKGG